MKNKSICLILIIMMSFTIVKAQKNTESGDAKQYKYSIGLGLGSTTGAGISFRFIPKKIGFQINIMPRSTNYGDNMNINSGLTLLGRISETEYANLYVYLANNYIYKREKYTSFGYPPIEITTETGKWNSGIGVGVEFLNTQRVVLNLMVGFGQYNTFETITLAGEIALYFRFNTKKAEEKVKD